MTPARKRTHSLRPFVQHLSEMAASLPSSVEVGAAKNALEEIIAFLKNVRSALDDLPTSDAAGAVMDSIQVFDRLLDSAQKNATLGLALGLTPPIVRKAATVRVSEEEGLRGREIFEQLAPLTIDQVRDRLVNDQSLRVSDLRALAGHLHVRFQSKSKREALAQMLTTRIANARGYEALSSPSET